MPSTYNRGEPSAQRRQRIGPGPTVSIDSCKEIARRVRRHILEMTHAANSGHPGRLAFRGGDHDRALLPRSCATTRKNPAWPDRDRFVMSKGHATPVIYSVLAEAGYFPVEELMTFRQAGQPAAGPLVMGKPPGVEMSAGALGMGLSFSLGQALAGRLDRRDYHVVLPALRR